MKTKPTKLPLMILTTNTINNKLVGSSGKNRVCCLYICLKIYLIIQTIKRNINKKSEFISEIYLYLKSTVSRGLFLLTCSIYYIRSFGNLLNGHFRTFTNGTCILPTLRYFVLHLTSTSCSMSPI